MLCQPTCRLVSSQGNTTGAALYIVLEGFATNAARPCPKAVKTLTSSTSLVVHHLAIYGNNQLVIMWCVYQSIGTL